MARSGIVKTNVSGSFVMSDGTGSPVTFTAAFDRGDLAIGDMKEVLNEDVAIERRGKFINAAHGNRVYPSISFSCWVDAFAGVTAAPGTELGFITRGGQYTANVSTFGAGTAVPYAMDFAITVEGTDFGDTADHSLTADGVQITSISFDEAAEGMSVSFTGVIRGAIGGDLAMDEVA